MVKDNQDRETAFRVRNLKDQIKRNNEEFIQNQKQQQAKTEHKNASGGNTNSYEKVGGNSFHSKDQNTYKPRESFSDYFKQKNIEFDLKSGEANPPKLNVSEFYKGFVRFNSYAWGIAASFGLVCFISYKLIDKASKFASSNKEQEQKQ
ncbi:hypothetical protein DICPUDRAFT_97620 [Dictyostelium purpureum]|uniref:Transmembrane protein n=1 Tax=Dictyostelium purpureum TaxID=5786 RepID=F0ZIC3_DICPU|nr:uncharacterized protein DICPUDRAFT_97620 [Dictyostelium purpureum]EGC36300.1 hypothetical protein DICPUDRAFT_97620 [Dictyostelium purpureum]|eukprot:XP_003287178.1 hypothetical protein DICPUDRAFT_97620 [Dictyostelium purpureum]